MATFSPLLMLLLYISMLTAPAGTQSISVATGFQPVVFTRSAGGSWERKDDAGQVISYRPTGSRIVARVPSGPEETTDLANDFAITGSESWQSTKSIKYKNPAAAPVAVTVSSSTVILLASGGDLTATFSR